MELIGQFSYFVVLAMEVIQPKIHHCVISPAFSQSSLSKAFSSKFSAEKEKRIGKIFGFISIESNTHDISDFIEFIIENLKNNYSAVTNDKEPEGSAVAFELEKKFELAIQKTNQGIASFLQQKKLHLDLAHIHIIAGIIKEKNICFTATGEVSGLLVHYRKPRDYSIITIYENSHLKENEINPLKFFSQTITGRVEKFDSLFFCTANIQDYLSLEKIKNMIWQNSPSDAISAFKTFLSSLQYPRDFVGTLIQLTSTVTVNKKPILEQIKKIDYAQAANHDSMRRLDTTQRATEKYLHPSLTSNLRKGAQHISSSLAGYASAIKQGAIWKFASKKKETSASQPRIESSVTRDRRGWQEKVWSSINPNLARFQKFIRRFSYLPRQTQLIIIVLGIALIILGYSLMSRFVFNAARHNTSKLDAIILSIQSKRDAAEASLIYQDEDMARAKFIEAKNELDAVPFQYREDERIKNLEALIDDKLSTLEHVVNINDVVTIGNWKNLDASTRMAPVLAAWRGVMYGQNAENHAIYKLNLESHVLSSVLPEIQNVGEFINAAMGENEIYFLTSDLTLYAYRLTTDDLSPIPIQFPEKTKLTATRSFAGRLYVLDSENNQIYRATKTSSGFGSLEEWIDDSLVDVTNAVDFAVDGNIYVLKKDGRVIKINRGKLSEFSIKAMHPPLERPKKIFTDNTTENIYILDPDTKRIVVVDKEGALLKQYQSEQFNDLKDFVVLEKEKRIYLLNGTTVLGITIK